MAENDKYIQIIINYKTENEQVVSQSVTDFINKLNQLKINVSALKDNFAGLSGLNNDIADSFKETAEKLPDAFQDLFHIINDPNLWKKVLQNIDVTSSHFTRIVDKLFSSQYLRSRMQDFYKTLEKFGETIRIKYRDIYQQTTLDVLKHPTPKYTPVDMQAIDKQINEIRTKLAERLMELTSIVQARFVTLSAQWLQQFSQNAQKYLDTTMAKVNQFWKQDPNTLTKVYEIVFQRLVEKGQNVSEILVNLMNKSFQAPNVFQFLNEIEKAIEEINALQEQYGLDIKGATEKWIELSKSARGYRSELLEMGMTMWFLSVAMNQLNQTIELMVSDNEIMASSFQLVANSLSNLSYGWFAWSRMLEMYMIKFKNIQNLPENLRQSTLNSIARISTVVGLIISLIVSAIPYIVQFSNKIMEGFINFSKKMSEIRRDIETALNPRTLEEFLSAITDMWRKFRGNLKKEGLTVMDLFNIRSDTEVGLKIQQAIEKAVFQQFFKTAPGKQILEEAKKQLQEEMATTTEPIDVTLPIDLQVEGAIPLEPTKQQIRERAKQIIQEAVGLTQKELDRIYQIEMKRWTDIENKYRTQILPQLSTQEQIANMTKNELSLLERKAKAEGDFHKQWMIYAEEKKRQYRELGYTVEQINELLKIDEQEFWESVQKRTKQVTQEILEMRGQTYQAFLIGLELEADEMRKQGINATLIERWKTEKIKQYWEDVAEKQREFYIDLAELRGEDEEVFKLQLERQKQAYIDAGISMEKIKEWETLMWKKHEEEKTEKLKEEQRKREAAERDFWIDYYRTIGNEKKAFELELLNEELRLKEQGYIDDLQIAMYIEAKKNKHITDMRKDLMKEFRQLTSSNFEYDLYTFAERLEKYRDYEELRPYITMLASAKIKSIYNQETQTIIREIEDRLRYFEQEQEKELNALERTAERRKSLLKELYEVYLPDEGLEGKIFGLISKYWEDLKNSATTDLADMLIIMNAMKSMQEYNTKAQEQFENELRRRRELTADIETEILEIQGRTFDAEIENLIRRVNEYIKSGASIESVERYYNAKLTQLKKEETDKWIAEEKRKYENMMSLQEKIEKFQQKATGKKTTKIDTAIEEKVEETKNLVRDVFELVDSGELTLEQAIDMINKEIIPYIDLTSELGRFNPKLGEANRKAREIITNYIQDLIKIYTSAPKLSAPKFEDIIYEKTPELKPPKIYTEEDILKMINDFKKFLTDLDKIIDEYITNESNKIKEKYLNLILNDPEIQESIKKIIELPSKLLEQINWEDLGADIGSDIAEGLINGTIDTLTKMFPNVDWKSLIGGVRQNKPETNIQPEPTETQPTEKVKMAAPAGITQPQEEPKKEEPAEENLKKELISWYLANTDRNISDISNLLNKLYNLLEQAITKQLAPKQEDIVFDKYELYIQTIRELEKLKSGVVGLPAGGETTITPVSLPEQKFDQIVPYTLAKYLEERQKYLAQPDKFLFSGDVSYEEAGFKDWWVIYKWVNTLIITSEEYLQRLEALQEWREKEEKAKEKQQTIALPTTEEQLTNKPGIKLGAPAVSGIPNVEVKVYIDGKEIKNVVTEVVTKEVVPKV